MNGSTFDLGTIKIASRIDVDSSLFELMRHGACEIFFPVAERPEPNDYIQVCNEDAGRRSEINHPSSDHMEEIFRVLEISLLNPINPKDVQDTMSFFNTRLGDSISLGGAAATLIECIEMGRPAYRLKVEPFITKHAIN